MKLFIDTWGWVTIYNRREARHEEIILYYGNFREQGGIVYTTDYVLDETFTLLFRRLPFNLAKKSVEILETALKEGYLDLKWITPERFETAKSLRFKFEDKPTISFTDLTSMAVIQELGITQVMTGDAHFAQVGMDLLLVP